MTLQAAPLRLSTESATFEADFKARLHWSADTDAAIEQRVADILADVQKRGDAAVIEYTQRVDGRFRRSARSPAPGAGAGGAPCAQLPRGAEEGLGRELELP